eukprot:7300220-Prymnesium_polylepis.1
MTHRPQARAYLSPLRLRQYTTLWSAMIELNNGRPASSKIYYDLGNVAVAFPVSTAAPQRPRSDMRDMCIAVRPRLARSPSR